MRIAINITPLTSAHKGRGVGIYTKNLVSALETYGKQHTYLYFTGRQSAPRNADVVHYPYFDPFFLTLPLVKQKPTVVTVHDLIPLVFPNKFPAGIRGNITWQVQKLSLRRVSRIIADSNSSKSDILRIVGVKKEGIDTVYLAPDPIFHPITERAFLAKIQKKYSTGGQFLLYVGDVNWNKNILGFLEAYKNIRNDIGMPLVLVGNAFIQENLPETREILHFLHDHHLEDAVNRIGRVSDEDLAALYSLAAVYVQPSYYEGFGLPVLEAMACGCPVVCTNTSSLKEIAGPAVRVSPKPEDIFSGITKMLTISRKTQQERQLAWVKQFTWEKVAVETIAAYERASV
jgi:glycosyltransferase involved in cell wall biosynthesis